MTVRMVARPVERWPGQLRDPSERILSQFTASWTATTILLRREVGHLTPSSGETDLVVQLAVTDSDLRNDGWVRADAKPEHPGVVVAFESKHGPLQYFTDLFCSAGYRSEAIPGWQANVRAIALGLEALRRVDRYGVAHSGEQYTGWRALPAAPSDTSGVFTARIAAELLAAHGTWGGRTSQPEQLLANPELVATCYRAAAKRLHPDRGGDPALFHRIREARDLLLAEGAS